MLLAMKAPTRSCFEPPEEKQQISRCSNLLLDNDAATPTGPSKFNVREACHGCSDTAGLPRNILLSMLGCIPCTLFGCDRSNHDHNQKHCSI
jgi:hypothetical protein